MEQKSPNFSMADAARMANSDAGKKLISLLQQSDSQALKQAMEQASGGDYSKLPQTLAPLLASEEVKKLLKQLGG